MLRTVMHTHSLLRIQAIVASLLCPTPIVMPLPTTKAQWVAKLQEEGVTVPSEWTLLQIKAHYAEIMETQKQQGNSKTLEETDLRRRAKKKADTIAALTAKGERAICQKYPPQGGEKVGFGKHGDLSLDQVIAQFPSYVNWCRETIQDAEDPYWKMERLVPYADQRQSHKDQGKGYFTYSTSRQ